MRQTTVWLLCFALLSGCMTMKPLRVKDPTTAPFDPVEVGDTVVVYTKDGRTDRFIVAEISGDTIVSANGGRYSTMEIERLEYRSVHVGRTVALSVAIFVTYLIVVVGPAIACIPGGCP